MTRTELPTLPASEAAWRHLDPRMLLVHPVQELIRFLPAVLGALFVGESAGGVHWELIGVAFPIVLGLLRFFTTSYRVTSTQVELRRGLVGTTVLTAPLDRVRTVELTSTPIHRLLGLGRVEIGTAGAGLSEENEFSLDALALNQARALRSALLHRVETTRRGEPAGPDLPTADEVLVRLELAWVRYAPLTSAGNVAAAGLLAFLLQFEERLGIDPTSGGAPERWLQRAGPLVDVAAGVGAFLVLGSLLAVLGYLVANWGFTLSQDARRRSIHSVRGLLTHTETSIEKARLRGVELGQPLGLRLAGASRLNAIVTGLSSGEGSSATLVPAAPRSVVVEVGETLLDLDLGGNSPLRIPLRPHGPAARRRRITRALTTAVAGTALLTLGAATSHPPWPVLLGAAALLPLALWLGRDRYHQLGHALSDEHLVVASGTFRGRRDVLACSGIIGWNIEQSFFQRRAGLVTLVATTAAGRQRYAAIDLPEATAVALADAAVPGLLTAFLT